MTRAHHVKARYASATTGDKMAAVFDQSDQKLSSSENFDNVQEYDVIIVGAGFSGISALHRLRNAGLQAHIFEAGTSIDSDCTQILQVSPLISPVQVPTLVAFGTGTAILARA
jgi:heterodisulfide reductase subunit A-like polyferredoxin